jgi:hypothetical protein
VFFGVDSEVTYELVSDLFEVGRVEVIPVAEAREDAAEEALWMNLRESAPAGVAAWSGGRAASTS